MLEGAHNSYSAPIPLFITYKVDAKKIHLIEFDNLDTNDRSIGHRFHRSNAVMLRNMLA